MAALESPPPAVASWRALGTGVALLVDVPEALAGAREELERELERIDVACSRFRPDSDLMRVNRARGRAVPVGPALLEALEVALAVAGETGGSVTPTLGRSLRALGYDRDFAAGLAPRSPRLLPPPGAEAVHVDRAAGTVALSDGAELDLGATAKALAADRAARAAHERTGAAVLVNLGGDVAVAGHARAGWRVRVTDDHAAAPDAPGQTVEIAGGGLATSSTTARRWGPRHHHIVDPATGRSCVVVWRTASVAAASCVAANAAATAAIVLGDAAPAWLEARGLPSRLVAAGGRVTTIAGWP